MFKQKLDSIKDPYMRAFAWRVYNTFKSVILPLTLPLILLEVQAALQEAGDFSPLLCREFWISLSFVVTLALLGAAITGFDKVRRMD
jgi:hypothetical protein